VKKIEVKKFYQTKQNDFLLSLITDPATMERDIVSQYLSRPGLAFAGYFEQFDYRRIQVLGEKEISFLQSQKSEQLYRITQEIFTYDIPCFIVTKGLSVPEQMIFLANDLKIPIFVSRLTTEKLYDFLRKYLADIFAPSKTIHGTLVDVFGVGVLLTGKSGIGKSECALDLVERGQRLVTDDVVKMIAKDGKIIGKSANNYGYFMEVRGIGLIDVAKMFGIHAVCLEKQIDVQIELMQWKDNMDYERIGLTENHVNILDTKIPIIYLPVSSGKNVSVIIEVVAMNYMLKSYGYDAAKEFTQKIQADIIEKSKK